MNEEKDNKLPFLHVLVEQLVYIESLCSLACIWVGMLLLLSLGRLTWSSVLHLGFLKFVQITKLKVNLNRLKIHFWITGFLRRLLLTPSTKLFISLGIRSGHLALLNVLYMLDFPGLDLLVSWFDDKVSFSVTRCYNAALVWTIFTTWAAFCSIHRDVLPIFQQSNLIYKFQCCCNDTCRGRTS